MAALQDAKQHAITLLKENRRAEASQALTAAAYILCLLNSPSRARSFTKEAHDLTRQANDPLAAGYALAVGVLARMRLGDFEKADALMDRALEALHPYPDHEFHAFALLIAAELSMARGDETEARVFAEDAFAAAATPQARWIRARACLIKAVCEERTGNLKTSLELLQSAEQALKEQPDAETQWLVQAALAETRQKTGEEQLAGNHRKAAQEIIERVASELEGEVRRRFLKSPAIPQAVGRKPPSTSGLWKVPVQIPSAPTPLSDDAPLKSLRPVLDVIKKINTEHDLRKLLTMILDIMNDFCNAQRGTIVLFEGDRFKVEVSRDRARNELKRFEQGVSRTVLKLVREQGRRVVAEDAQKDVSLKLVETVHDQSLLSILCLPLRVRTRLLGAVYLDNPYVAGAFGPREIEIAEILTEHAAVALDNALLYLKTIHDQLTGAYNHAHFEKLLEGAVHRARRRGRSLSLMIVDLDDFKMINDTRGHETGNAVLCGVTNLITSTLRSADPVIRPKEREIIPVVARYGGDEFEVLLPEAGRDELRHGADCLLKAVRESALAPSGTPLHLTVSIGGAVYPDDADDPRKLFLKADEALYEAKRTGKNRFVTSANR